MFSWHLSSMREQCGGHRNRRGMQGNTTTLAIVIILACAIGMYGVYSVGRRMRKTGPRMVPSSPMLAHGSMQGSLQSNPFGPAPNTVNLTGNVDTVDVVGATYRPPLRAETVLSVDSDSLGLSPPSPPASAACNRVRCNIWGTVHRMTHAHEMLPFYQLCTTARGNSGICSIKYCARYPGINRSMPGCCAVSD